MPPSCLLMAQPFSEEGTTQGDPLAMPMYAMATIPLINLLDKYVDLKQVWYADDATATGSLHSIRQWWNHLVSAGPAFGYFANATATGSLHSICQWWNHLVSAGPAFGYFANASKTWLLTKEEHLDHARSLFQGTLVNITTHGRPHLGAALAQQNSSINLSLAKSINGCKRPASLVTLLIHSLMLPMPPLLTATYISSHSCQEPLPISKVTSFHWRLALEQS